MSGYVYEFRVRRVRRSSAAEPAPMSDPQTAAQVFRQFVIGEAREVFMCAALDTRNYCLGVERVAIGSLASVDVHPREVFRAAILAGAASIVIAHNHPSGNPSPSSQDFDLTARIYKCGEMLGIPLLDHVVVTDDDYTSIAERLGSDGMSHFA